RIKGLRSLTAFRSGSASSCCTTSTLAAPCLGGGLPQRLHIARPVATIPPATISMSCFIAPSVQVGEAGKVPDGYDEKMVCHDRAGFGLQKCNSEIRRNTLRHCAATAWRTFVRGAAAQRAV